MRITYITFHSWCSGQWDRSWENPVHSGEMQHWCGTPIAPVSTSGFAKKGTKQIKSKSMLRYSIET